MLKMCPWRNKGACGQELYRTLEVESWETQDFTEHFRNLILGLQRLHCLGKERTLYYLVCLLLTFPKSLGALRGKCGMLCADCFQTASCTQRVIFFFFKARDFGFLFISLFCVMPCALFRHLAEMSKCLHCKWGMKLERWRENRR